MSKKKKVKTSVSSSPTKNITGAKLKTESAPSFWTNINANILLVFFLSIGIYTNTITHQYAVDDSIVILRNQYTKKGFKGMKGIWTEDTFSGFFGGKRNLVAGGRYRPFSLVTFAAELQLFGKVVKDANGNPKLDADGDINYAGNPMISHLINIMLYGWLCVIVYLLMLQLFNPRRDQSNLKGYFIATVAALLYATHPIHTEAVANIKGRDEILVFLGSLLALYWVLKATINDKKKWMYMLGASVAFTMAIFSKENAVTFLAIIPAALYFFTDQKTKNIVFFTAPFVLITAIFWFGIRSSILGDAADVLGEASKPAVELMNDPFLKIEGNKYVPFTFEERISTVMYTWLEYIKLLAFPHPLTNDYYPKHIRTDQDIIPTYQMGKVLFSFLIHVGLIALMLWGTLRRRHFAFFILFYFATFSVVSNLIFPIGSNMAERFMFLPSLAFSALCAMGLYKLVQGKVNKTHSYSALKIPTYLLIFVCFLYSIKTFSRNFAWYDDYTLFTTDIVNSPNSAKLNNAVSGVLQDKANKTQLLEAKKALLNDALDYSITATNLHPTYNNAWLLRGNANVLLGNIKEIEAGNQNDPNSRNKYYLDALALFDKGIEAYNEVSRLRPDHPDVKRNFSVVYRDRGKLLGQRLNRLDESIQSIEMSLSYSKKDFECFRLLGVAYGMKGLLFRQQNMGQQSIDSQLKAIEYFKEAISMNAFSVPILYNLEVAYRNLGMIEQAEEVNQRWKEINPEYNPMADQQ